MQQNWDDDAEFEMVELSKVVSVDDADKHEIKVTDPPQPTLLIMQTTAPPTTPIEIEIKNDNHNYIKVAGVLAVAFAVLRWRLTK